MNESFYSLGLDGIGTEIKLPCEGNSTRGLTNTE